jgi:hypothetical protein
MGVFFAPARMGLPPRLNDRVLFAQVCAQRIAKAAVA